jgi:integrase
MGRPSPLQIEGTGVSFRDPDEKGRPTVAMVRAKDERGSWQCKRFAITSWHRDGAPVLPEQAKEWAKTTRKTFIKDQALATAATFQDFATLLGENLTAAGVTDGYVAIIKAISSALLAEGLADMRSDAFPTRIRTWLTGLKAGWSFAEDAKNKRKGSEPLSAATRNKLLGICRQVTGLAVKMRRLPFDPLDQLPRFREKDTLKPLFTLAELRHMVSDVARDTAINARAELERAIALQGGTRTEAVREIAKDRKVHWTSIYNALKRKPEQDPWWLAACLLVYTGCRAQEAMHLRWEWIKWDSRQITLKLADDYEQKTDSERIIPLEPELHAILEPMAKTFGHILPPEIRAGGSGMRKSEESAKTGKGAGDYTGALGRYLNRVGIDIADRTAHSLRHNYISMKIARDDQNLDKLRKAVGHAQISTTQHYSKLSQLFEAEVETWPDKWLWLRRSVPAVAKAGVVQ